MTDDIAYKILTASQCAALQNGSFDGAPVDVRDGYIHLSTAAQVTETVQMHFAGLAELYIAAVDLLKLGSAVRWEVARGGQAFPHLYGRLRMAEVLALAPLRWQAGAVVLPSKN